MDTNIATTDTDTEPFFEPIDYKGNKYVRSDVEYATIPLSEFLQEREVALPEQLDALIAHMPAGTFIAGGAVAAFACEAEFVPKDIDLFFRDEAAFKEVVKMLSFAGQEVMGPQVPSGVRMFVGKDGAGPPIQTVEIAWYDGAINVIDAFDFTVCQFAIDVGTKSLVFNPAAPLDYALRRLVKHREEDQERTKKRIARYIAKGFRPVGWVRGMALDHGLLDKPAKKSTQPTDLPININFS